MQACSLLCMTSVKQHSIFNYSEQFNFRPPRLTPHPSERHLRRSLSVGLVTGTVHSSFSLHRVRKYPSTSADPRRRFHVGLSHTVEDHVNVMFSNCEKSSTISADFLQCVHEDERWDYEDQDIPCRARNTIIFRTRANWTN